MGLFGCSCSSSFVLFSHLLELVFLTNVLSHSHFFHLLEEVSWNFLHFLSILSCESLFFDLLFLLFFLSFLLLLDSLLFVNFSLDIIHFLLMSFPSVDFRNVINANSISIVLEDMEFFMVENFLS